jgi:hypothetical protein
LETARSVSRRALSIGEPNMTWSNDDALAYQRDWRKRNPDRVRNYKRAAQARRAADRARLDPKTWRQKYFRELHGEKIRHKGFACHLTAADLE